MSQLPPPDSSDFDHTLSYQGAPKSSALALTAMILGIVAIPTACLGIGALLGIVAVVLGIIARVSISKDPVRYGGKGMAAAAIATGFASVFLMIPLTLILIPSLTPGKTLSKRSSCVANLRGIMQSIIVYANDNNDNYPYLAPSVYATPGCGNPGAPNSVMYSMFTLVGSGMVAPKQFVCPADPAKLTSSIAPIPITAYPGYKPTYWTHPAGKDPNLTYSYSFAFQFSKPNELGNWWRNTVDAALPIAADMNPGNQNPNPVKNSLNHLGDGQSVAYADGHVEFSRIPTCGENNDHIYNTNSNNPNTPGTIGQPPFTTPAGNTSGTFDTCLIPGLINKTTYTRN